MSRWAAVKRRSSSGVIDPPDALEFAAPCTTTSSSSRSSTVDRAADEIRRALFAGQLTPGTPLREVALSEAMGVGRSTIREALGVLVADGMAVRIPNKGVAVKELERRRRPRRDPGAAGARERRHARAGRGGRGRPPGAARRAARATSTWPDRRSPTDPAVAHRGAPADPSGARRPHRQRAPAGRRATRISSEIRLGLAHLDRMRANIADQVREHTPASSSCSRQDEVDDALDELARHLDAAEDVAARGHRTWQA